MKHLTLGIFLLACADGAFAHGTVIFNNRIAGSLVAHVYWMNPAQMGFVQAGNGPSDTPAGATEWGAFMPLSGSGFTAELWAANGANQPDSLLQPAVPTTTFRTGAAAGLLAGTTATLAGVPMDAFVATIRLRVWDNQCGTITNWNQVVSGFGGWVDHGESPAFNVYGIGGVLNPAPTLVGLQSFNLATCMGPYFVGWVSQPTNQVVPEGGTATFVAEFLACPGASYQWYYDGAPLAAGEPCKPFVCQISNVQPTDAGNYWVFVTAPTVSGYLTNFTSLVATLTVLTPPIILASPSSQTAETGSSVRFRVNAGGPAPLTYSWFFNGTNALTATTNGDGLFLANIQPAQAGTYSVVVRNLAGAATSSPALLSVIPPVPRKMVPALAFTGQAGRALNLEFTETISPAPNWIDLGSVDLTNSLDWHFDLPVTLSPQGFYRSWQSGATNQSSTLDMQMIQAISLTGQIGGHVRIDAINQFGPIDAWFPLATVTLTTSSQVYFDTSMLGQPPRLYRLVQLP